MSSAAIGSFTPVRIEKHSITRWGSFWIVGGLLSFVSGVAAAPADSPFGAPVPGFSGQIRLRTEFEHKRLADPAPGTRMWTLERARLGYQATPNEEMAIKFEIQDNRVMGSEPDNGVNPATATVGNSKAWICCKPISSIRWGPCKWPWAARK